MAYKWIDDVLILTHPAMDRPASSYWGNMATEQFSPTYQFSWEMVFMLNQLYGGKFDLDNPGSVRAFKAAQRKQCYKDPLINAVGVLTAAGHEATRNARILYQRIWEFSGDRMPEPNTIDEIIVFGSLHLRSVGLLDLLWSLLPEEEQTLPDKYIPTLPRPRLWRIDTAEVEGRQYVLPGSYRNNARAREATEALIKFGLVDMVHLPAQGRGRPFVGLTLSEPGKLFYIDYRTKFDPSLPFKKAISTPPPVDIYGDEGSGYVPDTSTLTAGDLFGSRTGDDESDIVDGENLRELFGG